MLPDILLGVVTDIIGVLLRAFPSLPIPVWLSTGGAVVTSAASLGDAASGFAAWINFAALATVLTALLVVIPVAALVALSRIVMSYLTGGGGSQ